MNYIVLILSVLIGVVIVFGLKPSTKTVQLLLAFSGAYLLSITILHLFPEVYNSTNPSIGLFILLGLLFQLILDFFSKGAEHGHVHLNKDSSVFPWLLFISLCIHSFLEGFPIHQHNDMVYGVLIHKIPTSFSSFLECLNKNSYY